MYRLILSFIIVILNIAAISANSVYLPGNSENCIVTFEKHDKKIGFIPHGTGFLFKHLDYSQRFVVTNRHVLENCDSIWVRINIANENEIMEGRRYLLQLKQKGNLIWTTHPDSTIDLAVIPFLDYIPIYLLGSERIKTFKNVNLGDAVLFLGYPLLPAATGDFNYPLIRNGIVSFKTHENIVNPFNDKILAFKNHIIIDGHIMSGNSGSPVLSTPIGDEKNISLIGVISSHLFSLKEITQSDTTEDKSKYVVDYNLGICIPAENINETIKHYFKSQNNLRK